MTNQSGFFCGIALGVAAGILLAPRTGEKTRAMIGENARKGQDMLKQKSCETLDAAMSAVERGKAAAQRTADSIAETIAMGKESLAG
jgi:gas vesicle protein